MFGKCKHVWSKWEYFTIRVDKFDALSGEYLFTQNKRYRSRECYECGIVKEKKCR